MSTPTRSWRLPEGRRRGEFDADWTERADSPAGVFKPTDDE